MIFIEILTFIKKHLKNYVVYNIIILQYTEVSMYLIAFRC